MSTTLLIAHPDLKTFPHLWLKMVKMFDHVQKILNKLKKFEQELNKFKLEDGLGISKFL